MSDSKDLEYIKNFIIYMDCKIRSAETFDDGDYLKTIKIIEDKYPILKNDRWSATRVALDIMNHLIWGFAKTEDDK